MTSEERRRNFRSWRLLPLAVLVLASVLTVLWWQTAETPASTMFSNEPELLAQGRQVYENHCAVCHGRELEGQADWRVRRADGRLPAPPHDPSGHTWHHPSEQLFGIVKHGLQAYAPPGYESDMPAYAGVLSDEQIWAVLAFIRSTWPKDVRHRHEAIEQASRPR